MANHPSPHRPKLARGALDLARAVYDDFNKDNVMQLAAATAFYAMLSIGPLLVLLVWVGSLLGPTRQAELVDWINDVVGPASGEFIRTTVENANSTPDVGTVAGLTSIGALLLFATGLFAQLHEAMNIIWGVEARYSGAVTWLRRRAIALGVMILLGALLVTSVLASTMVPVILSLGGRVRGADWFWTGVHQLSSVAIYMLLFAAVFKVLPDVHVAWRHTWSGALLTATLFAIGKSVLNAYVSNSLRWSAYGAAGSLMTLLIWVYYSSIILYLGAEMTQVWTRRHGKTVTPIQNADWTGRKAQSAGRGRK